MRTSSNGLNFIKNEEGCRLTAYKLKNEKYYTIGVGHYGADVKAGQTISMAQALELLAKDVVNCENAVNKMQLPFSLTQNMFDALVSYSFNRGTGKLSCLKNSKTPQEMANNIISNWGSAITYRSALIERRKREANLFMSGYVNQATSCNHTQLNYQVGTGYCLTETMKVRIKAPNGTQIDTLKRGTWVLNNATTRIGESIWMYIGLDKKGREQWLCADNGTKCFASATQV